MDLDIIKNTVAEINAKFKTLSSLSNDELRESYTNLRKESLNKIKNGMPENDVMDSALIDVFALFKEVARRFAENEEIKVSQTDLDIKLFNKCDFIKECEYNPEDGMDYSFLDTLIYVSSWSVGNEKFKWNIIPYDEQLMGGIALHEGKIIEMYTGEGKTFVSIAPVLLNALVGKSIHLMTANAYLSQRDFEITRPIYSFFGLSVGCIEGNNYYSYMRKKTYEADVVFGTTSSFVFDYLFDMLSNDLEKRVQNRYDFAILDEADSMLIDEASTPHIVSSTILSMIDKENKNSNIYNQYLPTVQELIRTDKENKYFIKNKIKHTAEYTREGETWLSEKLQDNLLFSTETLEHQKSQIMSSCKELTQEQMDAQIDILTNQYKYRKALENALRKLLVALTVYEENVDYIIKENEITIFDKNTGRIKKEVTKVVLIVDENTGRIKESHRWEYGLHEAIEAKEGINIDDAFKNRKGVISIKNYLKRYTKIGGMTGTALSCSKELKNVYGLSVQKIPTHRPVIRKNLPLRVFQNQEILDNAVIDVATDLQKKGHPVLVCTQTIKRCEILAKKFESKAIKVQVLNGKTLSEESKMIANAGMHGCITVATSVAGRGTDIKLDEESIRNGGLAVIGVGIADSIRIDQQLAGRSGRQGNPGSSQFFVSLEDDILEYLPDEEKGTLEKYQISSEQELTSNKICDIFHIAQRICMEEKQQGRENANLRDDAIDSFRGNIYSLKNRMLKDFNEADNVLKELGHSNQFVEEYERYFRILTDTALPLLRKIKDRTYVTKKYERLPLSDGTKVYSIPFNLDLALTTKGKSICAEIEKNLLVKALDKFWIGYINEINNESLDPTDFAGIFKVNIKKMLDDIKGVLAKLAIPVNIVKEIETKKENKLNRPILNYVSKHRRIINITDLCPCGSGKQFWECHGNPNKGSY